MTETDKVYLGDSVYAALEGGAIKLTTENGYGPSNTIILELEVFDAMVTYVKNLKAKYAAKREAAAEVEAED